jgi:uncharacterized protein YprB with RNaseH-like and TPR domain
VNPDTNKGAVYFSAPNQKIKDFKKGEVEFVVTTEKGILERFWAAAEKYDEFVTYNGHSFDVPFLIMRSMAHKIKPTKNIMSNRYYRSQDPKARHVDLMDQFTFYGAVPNRPKLHLVCRALGIKSPKEEGISGADVAKLFAKGYYKKIAEYNLRDTLATASVYRAWREYLRFGY